MYVQQSLPDLKLLPPVMIAVPRQPSAAGKIATVLKLQNVFDRSWAGVLKITDDDRWTVTSIEQKFAIEPGQQATLTFDVQPKPGVPRGRYPIFVTTALPDGRPFIGCGEVAVTPSVQISQLPAGTPLAKMRDWTMPGGPLMLDRAEQVVVGRPPAMASLQEKQYWAGPSELSGSVKVAGDESGLIMYVEVVDANARLPKPWPGVGGSCVELFFDFRSTDAGLGTPPYSRDVYQLIIRPPLDDKQTVATWKPSVASHDLPGLTAAGGRIDMTHYWIAVKLPWKDLGVMPGAGTLVGFDVGVDGAKPDGGRKSQMMLFGTPGNNRDASGFGIGVLRTSDD
jgi:hypothetical protein